MSEMLIKMLSTMLFPVMFEKDDGGGGGGGTGEPETGKPDPANPGAPAPVTSTATSGDPAAAAEVSKAYEKLRATEAQLSDAKKDAAKVPSLQQENDQLKAENAELKKGAAESSSQTVISAKARQLNFVRPDKAMQAIRAYTDVDPLTLKDEAAVEKALRDLATAETHLVGTVPPSGGEIRPAGEQTGGNAAVNRAIRAAAGR